MRDAEGGGIRVKGHHAYLRNSYYFICTSSQFYYLLLFNTTDLYFVDVFDPVFLIRHELRECGEHLTKLHLKGGVFMLVVPIQNNYMYVHVMMCIISMHILSHYKQERENFNRGSIHYKTRMDQSILFPSFLPIATPTNHTPFLSTRTSREASVTGP